MKILFQIIDQAGLRQKLAGLVLPVVKPAGLRHYGEQERVIIDPSLRAAGQGGRKGRGEYDMSPDQPVRSEAIQPEVTGFFDPATNTISYVVSDPQSAACAIIDSVLDFEYASGAISYQQADEIINFVTANKLTTQWLIETHVHADHLSAAPYLQEKLGGKIGISRDIASVQDIFGKV